MESRIIELVSNASQDVYPNNTVSSFVNFFPENIEMNGDWEVALMELCIPARWLNVTDGQFILINNDAYVNEKQNSLLPEEEFRRLMTLTLPCGLYESYDDIRKAMNHLAQKEGYNATIDDIFPLINGRLSISKSVNARFELRSNDLSQIFGLKTNFYRPNQNIVPIYPHDLTRFHTILVYADIIHHDVVGDVKVPLLRSVPIATKLRDGVISIQQNQVSKSFTQLQYKRLFKRSFHSIKIELRSTFGELIPFIPVGEARLALHFRKISREKGVLQDG